MEDDDSNTTRNMGITETHTNGQNRAYTFVSNVELLAGLISFDNASILVDKKALGSTKRSADPECLDDSQSETSSCASEDLGEIREREMNKLEEYHTAEALPAHANDYHDNVRLPSSKVFDSDVVNVSGNNKHAHGDQLLTKCQMAPRRRSPRKSKTVVLELGKGTEGIPEENVTPSPRRRSPGKSTMVLVTSVVRPKDIELDNGTGDGQEHNWRLRKSSSGSGRRQWYDVKQNQQQEGTGGSPQLHRHRRPNRLYFFSDDEGEPAVEMRKLFSPRKYSFVTPHEKCNEETMMVEEPKVKTSRKSRPPSHERGDRVFDTGERRPKSPYGYREVNANVNNEGRNSSNSTGSVEVKKPDKGEKSEKKKKKKDKKGKAEEAEPPIEEEAPKKSLRTSTHEVKEIAEPEQPVAEEQEVKATARRSIKATDEEVKPVVRKSLKANETVVERQSTDQSTTQDQSSDSKVPKKKDNKPIEHIDKEKEKEKEQDNTGRRPSRKSEKEVAKKTNGQDPEDKDPKTNLGKGVTDSELGVIVYQIEVRFIVFKNLRFCGGVRVLMNCQEEKAFLQLITLMNEVFATYDIDNICFLEPRSAAGVSFCAVPYQTDKDKEDDLDDDPNLSEKQRERRKRCKEKKKSRLPLIEHAEVVFCTPEQMVRFKTVIDTLLCAISCIDTTKPPRHLTDMVCDGTANLDDVPEDQQEFLNTCFEDPPDPDGMGPYECQPSPNYDCIDENNPESQFHNDQFQNRQSIKFQNRQPQNQQQYQNRPPQSQQYPNRQSQGQQQQYQNRPPQIQQFQNRQSQGPQQFQNRQSQQGQQQYPNRQSQYGTRPSQSQLQQTSRQSQQMQQGVMQSDKSRRIQFAPGTGGSQAPYPDPAAGPSTSAAMASATPTTTKKFTTLQCFDPCPKDPSTNSMACLPCDLGDPYQLNTNEGRVVFCTPACLKIASRTGEKIVYKGKLKIVQGCGGIGFIVRVESIEGATLYCHSLRRDLSLYSTQEVPFGFGYSTVVCTAGRTTMESFVVAFPSAYQRDQFQHAVNTCKDILGMTSVQSLTHVKTVL